MRYAWLAPGVLKSLRLLRLGKMMRLAKLYRMLKKYENFAAVKPIIGLGTLMVGHERCFSTV